MAKRVEQSTKTLEKFKENDEKIQIAKVAKAEKMKPGPRLLHTAAMQSVVLRERNLQMAIKEEFEKVIMQEELKIVKGCDSENNPCVKDEETLAAEKKANTNNYKKELMNTIAENVKQRNVLKKNLLEEHRFECEHIDREIKRQIEKERLVMENKRALLRKNAVEAMKMVEQRRLRDYMVSEVKIHPNCVYNKGKGDLDRMLSEKLCKPDFSKIVVEEKRLESDISRMQLQLSEEELEKKQRERVAKQARIEAHLREVERQKQAQRFCCDKQCYEMAQRFKNQEVNVACEVMSEQEERLRQQEQFRSILKEQLAEKGRGENSEKEAIFYEDDPYIQDDQKFFELAREYIKDANNKNRPLYPFIKAVEQYKRDNQIDCVHTLPKHLISKISLGCREAVDSKANALHAAKQKEQQGKMKTMVQCLNTHDLLVDSVENQSISPICAEKAKLSEYNAKAIFCRPTIRYSISQLKQISNTTNIYPQFLDNI